MATSIKWTDRALDAFYDTAIFLETEYSEQVAQKFVTRVFNRIELLIRFPTLGKKSPKRKNVRFIIIEKHYRLYYRTTGKQIIIFSLFDTRQHPNKDFYQ